MYAVTTTTAGGAPISAEELRARLRLNEQGEDADLDEFLASAVEQFELDTARPVLHTAYRQDLARWPCGPIVLGRGGVTAVTAVRRYLADGSTELLAADRWRADLLTPPARVSLASAPDLVTTDAGIAVTPVGCVEFAAGWESADVVPSLVRTALMLLAGHWYEHREAYRDGQLVELPNGWANVVRRYKLGISGPWGQ